MPHDVAPDVGGALEAHPAVAEAVLVSPHTPGGFSDEVSAPPRAEAESAEAQLTIDCSTLHRALRDSALRDANPVAAGYLTRVVSKGGLASRALDSAFTPATVVVDPAVAAAAIAQATAMGPSTQSLHEWPAEHELVAQADALAAEAEALTARSVTLDSTEAAIVLQELKRRVVELAVDARDARAPMAERKARDVTIYLEQHLAQMGTAGQRKITKEEALAASVDRLDARLYPTTTKKKK